MKITAHCVWSRVDCSLAGRECVYIRGDRGFYSGPDNITLEKFENGTITGCFGFISEENWLGEITWLSWCHCFWKVLFPKCFPSTLKRKVGDVAQHGSHPANTKSCSLELQHISLILDIYIMFNWQLSYQEICWPVSHDHIAGLGL